MFWFCTSWLKTDGVVCVLKVVYVFSKLFRFRVFCVYVLVLDLMVHNRLFVLFVVCVLNCLEAFSGREFQRIAHTHDCLTLCTVC